MVPHSRKDFLFKDICSSGRRDGVVVVQHLLHHKKTRVSLVVAGDTETKLLVDVDRRLEAFTMMIFQCRDHLYLVVVPDIGDDVVHISLFCLLEDPLHQLLGDPLPDEEDDDLGVEFDDGEPPVPVEGADEPEVEAVVVGELATDCSCLVT